MPDERIEYDLVRAGASRGACVVLRDDFRAERESAVRADRLSRRGGVQTRRLAYPPREFFLARALHPVAVQQQFVDGALSQMVQLADGNEQAGRQRLRVDRSQREWRVTRPPELLAQLCGVERALRRRREWKLAHDRDFVFSGTEDRLERGARSAEDANVERHLPQRGHTLQ